MKNQKYHIITFILIAFLFSCAPNAENAYYGQDTGQSIILGFWHGIIIPFSLLGKLVGLPIGLLDIGKVSDPTYDVGFAFALYLYFRLLQPLVTHAWSILKERKS